MERPEDREYWLLAAYDQASKRGDVANLIWIASSLASLHLEDLPALTKGEEWLATLGRHLGEYDDGSESDEAERLRSTLYRLKTGRS